MEKNKKVYNGSGWDGDFSKNLSFTVKNTRIHRYSEVLCMNQQEIHLEQLFHGV
jgi:hypothetical protein